MNQSRLLQLEEDQIFWLSVSMTDLVACMCLPTWGSNSMRRTCRGLKKSWRQTTSRFKQRSGSSWCRALASFLRLCFILKGFVSYFNTQIILTWLFIHAKTQKAWVWLNYLCSGLPVDMLNSQQMLGQTIGHQFGQTPMAGQMFGNTATPGHAAGRGNTLAHSPGSVHTPPASGWFGTSMMPNSRSPAMPGSFSPAMANGHSPAMPSPAPSWSNACDLMGYAAPCGFLAGLSCSPCDWLWPSRLIYWILDYFQQNYEVSDCCWLWQQWLESSFTVVQRLCLDNHLDDDQFVKSQCQTASPKISCCRCTFCIWEYNNGNGTRGILCIVIRLSGQLDNTNIFHLSDRDPGLDWRDSVSYCNHRYWVGRNSLIVSLIHAYCSCPFFPSNSSVKKMTNHGQGTGKHNLSSFFTHIGRLCQVRPRGSEAVTDQWWAWLPCAESAQVCVRVWTNDPLAGLQCWCS